MTESQMNESQLYAEASTIALIGMGSERQRGGRGTTTRFRANDDPAAYWMMVECIVDLAKRFSTVERDNEQA